MNQITPAVQHRPSWLPALNGGAMPTTRLLLLLLRCHGGEDTD